MVNEYAKATAIIVASVLLFYIIGLMFGLGQKELLIATMAGLANGILGYFMRANFMLAIILLLHEYGDDCSPGNLEGPDTIDILGVMATVFLPAIVTIVVCVMATLVVVYYVYHSIFGQGPEYR